MNSAQGRRILIWVTILLTWEAAYRVIGWRAYIFPAPSHVIDATTAMLGVRTYLGEPFHKAWPGKPDDVLASTTASEPLVQRPLVQANLVSGLRLIGGFAISVACGALLGAIMWRWREMDQLLGPLFLGLQTLPSVCWVPLGIILFGLTEQGILFVLVMGSFSGVAISLRDGLRTIPPLYQRAGMMLGASGWRMYAYVLLPASLPALAGSLRQGFSFAWRSLMGAEVIFAVQRHGLGWLLQTGRDFNDVAQVVAVMIVMVMIGMLVDRFGFAKIEKHIARRFGLVQ
jgi:NitT/TauT family transport system permease protein